MDLQENLLQFSGNIFTNLLFLPILRTGPIQLECLSLASHSCLVTGMGEISKHRQLNEKKRYRAVQDLSFYEMRWIFKFSLKYHLMNEIDIFLIGLNKLKQYLNDISHIISLKAAFTFKAIISFNL
jgi:hypothetical protein